jgi:hypothetical protein
MAADPSSIVKLDVDRNENLIDSSLPVVDSDKSLNVVLLDNVSNLVSDRFPLRDTLVKLIFVVFLIVFTSIRTFSQYWRISMIPNSQIWIGGSVMAALHDTSRHCSFISQMRMGTLVRKLFAMLRCRNSISWSSSIGIAEM